MRFILNTWYFQLNVLTVESNGKICGNIEFMIYTDGQTYKHSKKQFETKYSDFHIFEEHHAENIGRNGFKIEVTYILSDT